MRLALTSEAKSAALVQDGHPADTSAREREIDERVYRLYGLTAEEIKILEESTQP
jgi:hypothetical protein